MGKKKVPVPAVLGGMEVREILRVVCNDGILYSIVCALRGPDLTNSEPLKNTFTWPIRWIASGDEDPVGVILGYVTAGNVIMAIYTLPFIEGEVEHYLSHVYSAYRSLYEIEVIPKDIFEYVRECIEVVKKISEMLRSGVSFEDIDVDSYTEPIVRLYKDLCEKYKVNERG